MMRAKLRFIFIAPMLILASLASSCLAQNSWRGQIDADFARFVDSLPNHSTLEITSTGGLGAYGIIAAEKIHEKNISLVVNDYCFSTCVDFLFGPASSIIFKKDAVVGIHGNFVLHRNASLAFLGERGECSAEHATLLLQQWRRFGVSETLVDQTRERLIVKRVGNPNADGSCGGLWLQHGVWFPDRKQLESIFGTKFEGDLCSESLECVSRKILPHFDSVVVGSAVLQGKAGE